MLKELRCDKLIDGKLEFGRGLNSLVGADDGTNSIGKSSVLMLVDFSLSGDDFNEKCSHVIENVGHFTVEMDFEFGVDKFSFSRSTNDPSVVTFLTEEGAPEKPVSDYRTFLSDHYGFPDEASSFRSSVNTTTRIWGKENDNPNKPLHTVANEKYDQIKRTLLKLFSYYGAVKELEKERSAVQKRKSILKGAFDEGYIKSLTLPQKARSEKRVVEVDAEITRLKESIENLSIDASQIINNKNLKLKSEKDSLLKSLYRVKGRLNRVEVNLSYGGSVNKKSFDKLKDYFPEVDIDKIAKIDQFHSGVASIVKGELRKEREILVGQVSSIEKEVVLIDKKLIESLGDFERPTALVDSLLGLSSESNKLKEVIQFKDTKIKVDGAVKTLKDEINKEISGSLVDIESRLNKKMAYYVSLFYGDDAVFPEVFLGETSYRFTHNDDSGTGKAYANMVSMDLSFLSETYVPLAIHDLIVFSNIEDHALEEIFKSYASSGKQIFIAIDKVGRFSDGAQKLIKDHMFLRLDGGRLAFRKSWKKRK